MTSRRKNWLILAVLLFSTALLHAQSSFVNLDSEQANIPTGTQPNTLLPAAQAFPGWTASSPTSYDWGALSGTVITVLDSSDGYGGLPIQGNYSAFLYSPPGPPPGTAATLSQTGLVPSGSRSITLDVAGGFGLFTLSLGGQTLPLTLLATNPNYAEYGADVSAFAGLPEPLTLSESSPTLRAPGGVGLDDVAFSPVPIPEPSAWALAFCGAVAIAIRRRRHVKHLWIESFTSANSTANYKNDNIIN